MAAPEHNPAIGSRRDLLLLRWFASSDICFGRLSDGRSAKILTGAGDAVVKHHRVMERYGLIARGGDNERRTFDLGQAAPAIERHRRHPYGHHQLAILARDEANDSVGTLLAELLQAL
jgi:hypothetical protein